MSKTYKGKLNDVYVSGSNAVKTENYYSAYKNECTMQGEGEKTKGKKKLKNEQGNSNRTYTIALVFAIIAMLGFSILLLKSQFAVTAASEEVIELQKDLVQIKKQNELLSCEIGHSVNMNEVYEIATAQLGMIQPTSEHIVYVTSSKQSYTVQYDQVNVPSSEAKVTWDNVLGFIN